MTNRKIQYWVIPPEADAEFVACMEEILDTYEEPYDPNSPVLCMDEQPVQLHKERERRFPQLVIILGELITSTNAAERPACSCSPSHWLDGER